MNARLLPGKRDDHRHYKHIDGAVVEAMNLAGFSEFIHNPSLVQHNGPTSSITGMKWGALSIARSFPGESFDCLSLLAENHAPQIQAGQ
jgi:hypothetical protein